MSPSKLALALNLAFAPALCGAPPRQTTVSIVGGAFHINGQPTYAGREWRGKRSRACS